MADIFQTTFSKAFSWIKMFDFRLIFRRSLFPKGPINDNIPALVHIMTWRRSDDKPLYEPMVVSLITHICVTRPQWVNDFVWFLCFKLCHSIDRWYLEKILVALQVFLHGYYGKWPLENPSPPSPKSLKCKTKALFLTNALQWRHNEHGVVSDHQPNDCLLNCLFRQRSKKTSKLCITGLCVGNSPIGFCVENSPITVNFPHKGPVTRKMFQFDDVIMVIDMFM